MLSFKRKAKTFKYKIEGTEAAGRFRARRLLGGIKLRIFRHFMLFSLIMLVLLLADVIVSYAALAGADGFFGYHLQAGENQRYAPRFIGN